MSNQNKIIIGLLAMIVIVLITQIVLDYQKMERKYRACFEQCQEEYGFHMEVPPKVEYVTVRLEQPLKLNICVLKCQEKYGK